MPTISTLTVDVNARTSNFSRGLRTVTTGLTVMAAGAIYAFKQFEDAQKIMNQTNAVLASTKGAANVTAEQVDNLSSSISDLTAIDDELIQSSENVLLTFTNIRNEMGRNNDIFNQATAITADLSVAMGRDLTSSATMVGKALNDPILGLTSLTRVGVQFTEQQRAQIERMVESNNILGAQKIILGELTTEFGGSAEAQKTASASMQVAFGNLAEAIGGVLAPMIEKLVGWITKATEWFTNLDKDTQTWITTAAAAAVTVALLAKAFGPLIGATRALGVSFTFLAAHPVIAAFIAFAAVIALVATKWDDLNGVVKVALTVLSPYAVLIGLIIRRFDDLKETAIDVWHAITEVARGAWAAVASAARTGINAIIGFLNGLIHAANIAAEAMANIASGPLAALVNVPDIPPVGQLQHGGMVARTGLAMVHQGEAFSGVNNEMGFGTVNITVNGWVGNDAQLAARLRNELLKLGNRNAGTGL